MSDERRRADRRTVDRTRNGDVCDSIANVDEVRAELRFLRDGLQDLRSRDVRESLGWMTNQLEILAETLDRIKNGG